MDLFAAAILAAGEDDDEINARRQTVRFDRFHYSRVRFSLDGCDDHWIRSFLVLSREEIRHLVNLFDLEALSVKKRYRHDPEFGLCLVLWRLSWPTRLKDLQNDFGLHRSSLSVIFNNTITYLCRRYSNMLEWHPTLLTKERLYDYADSLSPYGTDGLIWGWIDGTFKQFARPVEDQRAWYSGYKKSHGQKYQAVMTPDGLIASLEGPHRGAVNDMSMLHQSGIDKRMTELLRESRKVMLYGDEAYNAAQCVMSPYPGGKQLLRTDPEKAAFNKAMSSLRMSVEHGFGVDQSKWTANAFKIGNRSGLMPVAAYVKVSFLLTNCLTCLRGGNQISRRFGIDPPNIEDYLAPGEGRGLIDHEEFG